MQRIEGLKEGDVCVLLACKGALEAYEFGWEKSQSPARSFRAEGVAPKRVSAGGYFVFRNVRAYQHGEAPSVIVTKGMRSVA